jgi:hypothetical protein
VDAVGILAAAGATALAGTSLYWIGSSIVRIREIKAGHEQLNGHFDAIKKLLEAKPDDTQSG